MREVSERKKPSLSASKIPIRVTSGKSKPSLKRFTPTRQSNSPRRKSVRISIRSKVFISLCRYRAFGFYYEIKNLTFVSSSRLNWFNRNFWVNQSGGTNNLLYDLSTMFFFVLRWRCGSKDYLSNALFKFFKPQWPIVSSTR